MFERLLNRLRTPAVIATLGVVIGLSGAAMGTGLLAGYALDWFSGNASPSLLNRMMPTLLFGVGGAIFIVSSLLRDRLTGEAEGGAPSRGLIIAGIVVAVMVTFALVQSGSAIVEFFGGDPA